MGVGDDLPFMQRAAILRNEKFVCVEPLSGYARTLREDDGFRIFLPPDATGAILVGALLEALDKSRFVDPDEEPDFFEADRIQRTRQRWWNDVASRFGYKTKRQAYKTMSYCLVVRTRDEISIKPHKRDKPEYWRDLPSKQTVVFPVTTDPLAAGNALVLALSHCE